MRGRKPKPTQLKIVAGKPGHRALPQNEAKPARKIPKPPAIIQGIAKNEWRRISRLLYDAGLLTAIDGSALTAYCQSYATWVEAQEEIRKTGTVIRSTKGQPMVSPFLKVANVAWAQWTRMLIEFGMSPSSRSRVTVADSGKADPFEEFLKRGGLNAVPRMRSS
jgi:P27 family predicted phage terminase small subunit